ncbi:MAG: family 16 glycosylhydrolase [Saprospiraceae bacterium]|nr:family 16 glycosylhydrolase [Saprospiraceae bacterium]
MKHHMYAIIFLLSGLLLFTSCSKSNDVNPAERPVISGVDLSVVEGNTDKPVYVNIRLSAPYAETVTVTINTADETAKAGEDFVAINDLQLTFEPGDIQQSVKVDLLGDDDFESDETFLLVLDNASNATLPGIPIRITIENDDQDTNFDIPQTGYVSPTSYAGMQLIWSNEFGNDENLKDHWTFEIGNGNSGWGNNELQYYREENTTTKDGFLVIEAKKENFAGRNYTSSRIITRENFNFTYGRVDIRAALPEGQGLWPALWMLGSNFASVGWPECG